MPDYTCTYTLTPSGPSPVILNEPGFRDGVSDIYMLDVIRGLDGPVIRFPTDDVAFGDGGFAHKAWKGPRHPVFEGRIILQSVTPSGCGERFRQMEAALTDALEAMLSPTSGTLTFTPAGESLKTMTVFYEQSLDIQPGDNWRTRTFNFGLFSESADI